MEGVVLHLLGLKCLGYTWMAMSRSNQTLSFRKEVSIFPPHFVPRVSVGNR